MSDLTVAMLWPRHTSNVGVLARTCEAVGATFVTTTDVEVTCNTPGVPPLRLRPSDVDSWVRHRAMRQTVIAVECEGRPLQSFTPPPPGMQTTLLLGNERNGVPSELLSRDDVEVASLRQVGLSPSINVAVAGSVAAYWFANLLNPAVPA